MKLNSIDQTLLNLALEEDLGNPWFDATSNVLFSNDTSIRRARIISKSSEPIIVCGIELARTLFNKLSPQCQIHSRCSDGDALLYGQTLLEITGNACALLAGERVVLNFLRHLCAIATLTAQYVDQIKHTRLKILDTRKTTPGMRHLEKYAVHCGGGVNHRLGLYDAIMIKDTHIDLLGGIQHALEYLPNRDTNALPVIVEVRNRQELALVLRWGRDKVDRVLLDNMTPAALKNCVGDCIGIFETEASGNINRDTLVSIAETGVNYASIGQLTYGAGHVDLSMYTV